ncbi:MAG TPA: aminoglycoside phosphotransferase family protein [Pseudonocardiaceae bacterium]|jgi:aminoglycoside phosphotransferase (APT) family kinase protein|nr:aminoglycoside phosphotransferase family protein [Pseudonocardiaceae bacterium]
MNAVTPLARSTDPDSPDLGGSDLGGGRFTPDKLAGVLAGVCAVADLDPTGATLLRFATNAVFRLAAQPVVVRICGSWALRHRVDKIVKVANWLADHDFPAVRLLPGLPQPVRIGDYLATVWEEVPTASYQPTSRDLAGLLRRLHELPPPAFALPAWSPLDDAARRIADAERLAADDREFLEARCAEVGARLADLEFPLPSAVVHGDAHLGNLIPGLDGPVLCDFDSTCFGPPEWDLTPIPVALRRFGGSPGEARLLLRTYGFDVTKWVGFEVLREVRELNMVTSVLPILRSNPGLAPELHRRLASVRSGDSSARWARYR